MPRYRYRASDAQGKAHSDVLTASSESAAVQALLALGLTPTVVTAESDTLQTGKVQATHIALVTRQLSNLIDSGVSLPTALSTVAEQNTHAATRQLLSQLAQAVNRGQAFPEALAAYPKQFNAVYVGLVKAGLETSQLALVLRELADYLDTAQKLKQKIILALSYPLLVGLVSFLVIIAMLTYVMPQVVQAFSQSKQSLPWLTQSLLGLGSWLAKYGRWLLLALALVTFVLWQWSRSVKYRYQWDTLMRRLPLWGRLSSDLSAARYLHTLAILLRSGAPLLTALATARGTVARLPAEQRLSQVETAVAQGQSLADSLANAQLFDPIVLALIRNGEQSSRLSETLDRAANWQREAVNQKLDWFMGLIEPALIVVLGGLVLILVLAVMLPIVSINRLVR
jgi:general secretion pathway protein F